LPAARRTGSRYGPACSSHDHTVTALRRRAHIRVPASFWDRPEVITALGNRDIGRFFALVQQYTGASQTQIGIACLMPPGKVSGIIRGNRLVEKLEVFERIADGLGLPDPARSALGLAPQRQPGSLQAPVVPSASRLFTLDERDKGRWAGAFRYSRGYKTRVFTGAICPVPHETETVVSKGSPT
jgi:Helix-turn-helix domain